MFSCVGDCVLLKQLIPSTMAGVILGKGGDTINKLQTETATNIKMSKSGDFYPGKSSHPFKGCHLSS